MELFYETPDKRARLYLGDARRLPVEDESIDMIATSPPYWGKRDYGEDVVAVWGVPKGSRGREDGCEHIWGEKITQRQRGAAHGAGAQCGNTLAEVAPTVAEQGCYCSLCGAWRGQLGLEPTWQEFIAHLCECAAEWWRVLKPTGNLFVNMGDTFATHTSKRSAQFDGDIENGRNLVYTRPRPKQNYPEKSKLGIPYRLRFALNDMGWVSRDDIIWYKGKRYPDGKITKVAMPESVKDRMSCSYEMLFHFVKEPKGYWFDLDAVRRPHLHSSLARDKYAYNTAMGARDKVPGETREGRGYVRAKTADELSFKPPGTLRQAPEPGEPHAFHPAGANPGDVWIIQPEPFKEAHYAVWPSKLCERMIKVGCPKEVCPKCGKPRERITVGRSEHAFGLREREAKTGRIKTPPTRYWGGELSEEEAASYDEKAYAGEGKHTIGWSDCGCGEGFVPGVILDPFFGGSGRIAERALYLGRNVIGVDMKEEYLEMAKKRLLQGVLL